MTFLLKVITLGQRKLALVSLLMIYLL